jgi:hypothetical protein
MKFRLAVFAAACLAFGLYVLAGAAAAWEAGVFTLTFSKTPIVYELMRSQDPFWFYVWMTFDFLAAAALLCVAISACFAAMRRKPDARENLAGNVLEHLDQRAPSGLWPLAVGLSVCLVILLVFVSI